MLNDIPMKIKMNNKTFPSIKLLAEGKPCDESEIIALCDFINHRYDCSDFKMISILRSLYLYKDLISEETVNYMKRTTLDFKYAMEDPGIDGMCYWSENHQLIFNTIQYLAGHLFENEIFTNTGYDGLWHKNRALKQLHYWFETRFKWGFVEFHSNTYYEEDVAPLSILIDLAPDEDIKKKATILMDMILLDMAMHNFNGYFNAASGRCYEVQKCDPNQQDILDIMKYAFDIGPVKEYDYTRLSTDLILNKSYQVPPIIKEIAHSKEEMIIKDSMGLNLKDVKKSFENPKDLFTTGLYFWSMESFSNPESIYLTMEMVTKWNMGKNTFTKNLMPFNKWYLIKPRLLGPIIKILNPTTQGIAIQRANTYTYKHKDVMLSTAQMYMPRWFGDQAHTGGVSLGDTNVFITHPGNAFFDDPSRNFSPSYYVGNGVNPLAVQEGKKALYYFDLSVRKGYLEKERVKYTHLYINTEKFDEIIVKDNYLVGRLGNGLVGIKTLNQLIKYSDTEYRQHGTHTVWGIQVDSLENITLEAFVKQIKGIEIAFDKRFATFGNLKIDHKKLNAYYQEKPLRLIYDRYETPFINEKRESSSYTYEYNGHKLTLNLKELIRDVK
ncbi:MAG: hypothetical protein ACOX56_02920 [Acholeplasmataceae bacterium]|jgi:hypothetical protein